MQPGLWPAEVTPCSEMVRAERASLSRVRMSSSLTFASARPDAQVLRSLFGAESGAPRRSARAELYGRSEGELARGKRIRPLRTLAARLAALRAPLPENSSDFGLLCAQVYPHTGHRSSSLDFQQCRASLQPAQARQGGLASFSGRPARARQHAIACEVSGGRSIAYGTRAADGVRFTYGRVPVRYDPDVCV
jgi:hypothetical protein